MSDPVSSRDPFVLRLLDVTEEGLVVLEPPGFPYQARDKALRRQAYEELRQRAGANGTLLSVAQMSCRSASDAEDCPCDGCGLRRPRHRL